MSDVDPYRYLLSEQDSERIFQQHIVPDELRVGVRQDRPVVVFVAGQPGSGKTKTTEAVKQHLDRRGGAVIVNSDFYKPYHPEYDRLLATDDRTAAPYTSLDGRRWMAAAEQFLIANRIDTIIETTMRDPGDFLEPARAFRDAGYRVEAAILAVPEPLSRLGILHRYHDQVQQLGHGRLTARSNHDASYTGVIQAARAIDQERLVDVATVYRRGNVQLGINYLTGPGQWRWPDVSIAQLVDAERHRPWSTDEVKAFVGTVGQLAGEMGPQWHPELRDISAQAVALNGQQNPAALAALAFRTSTRTAVNETTQTDTALQPGTTTLRPDQQPGRGPTR
jgi:UDP-N-acetylglucosamine kinase